MSIKKYYNLAKFKLFPICRSITGKGIRKTLKIIKDELPELKIKSIKSGKKVFDWKIPSEWNIEKAYVLDNKNNKIIDFKKNNLHLVNYSIPINKKIKKKDLLSRLHVNKKLPNAIPYITSYYKKYWGFCCSYNQKKDIKKSYEANDTFRVVIDSSFKKNGRLNYGEIVIPGKSKQEILISTYVCHPSMANNELSGPIVSMALINFFLKKQSTSKTLRFLFIPETIGSIAYLKKNLNHLKSNVIGGYNLSCIGDNRMHSCILSKYKNSFSDLSLLETYKKFNIKYKNFSYLNWRGSDERQYNAPGIDLPITSIFRSKYASYPEYHTSLDNFDLVSVKGLEGGFMVAKNAIEILLKKIIPKSHILCEPNLGKRGLYPTISTGSRPAEDILNFLTYADGKNDLETISKYTNKNYSTTKKMYKFLKTKKLIS